jgi:hypothetical protein
LEQSHYPFKVPLLLTAAAVPMAARADLHVSEGGAVAGGTLPQAQSGALEASSVDSEALDPFQ